MSRFGYITKKHEAHDDHVTVVTGPWTGCSGRGSSETASSSRLARVSGREA
jgi:hypothetical protein